MINKLSKKDISILKIIEKDASLTNKQIAAIVNIAPSTLTNHLKQLKKNNIILRTVAVLNYKLLGKGLNGVIDLNLEDISEQAIETFIQQVIKIAGRCKCYHRDGEYNIQLKIMTADTDVFVSIKQQITGLANVQNWSTFICTEIAMPNT